MPTIQSKIMNMKTLLYEWIKMVEKIIGLLKDLADELDKIYKGVKISKVVGASVAIGGGVLAFVGFVLSFFTFGASFGLTIAGGAISGVGGATTGIAQAVDTIRSSLIGKQAEEALRRYNNHREAIIKECCKISDELKLCGNIDKNFNEWVEFWGKIVFGLGSVGKSVGWNVIGVAITGSRNIATGISMGGARAGMTAFKTIGSSTGRAFHIAGGVVGVLLMPLDVAVLVTTAIDIHKKNPNKASKEIRATANRLRNECPTEKEIDRFISHTLMKLTGSYRVNFPV